MSFPCYAIGAFSIDWMVVARFAAPVITLFIGMWANRYFESRPVLISYFGHVSSFHTAAANGTQIQVNTHAVVLRNVGRRSATNVTLRHIVLPDFKIWPPIAYTIATTPDGTREIVIPVLVPSEEITVSYLYYPPVTVAGINAGIKSDQGFARQIPVLLQRHYSRSFNRTIQALVVIGLISVLYLVYELARRVF